MLLSASALCSRAVCTRHPSLSRPACALLQPPRRSPLRLVSPEAAGGSGSGSPSGGGSATSAFPSIPLAISIQEVEAHLKPKPRVPAWAYSAVAEAEQAAKAEAEEKAIPRRPAEPQRLTALASHPKAAAMGLTPELCAAKIEELSLLLPEISYYRLMSLGDDELVDLMCDTASLATHLVELKARGAGHRNILYFIQRYFSNLGSSSWKLYADPLSPVAILTGHTAGVAAVAVAPDGLRAVTGDQDGLLKVWDLSALRLGSCPCTATLQGHTSNVTSVAISPDGRYALSASWDKTLRLWDLQTLAAAATLTGHTNKVAAVAITPDGQQAASASYDKSLRVWDLKTLSCTAVLKGHEAKVSSVAITPDGRLAFSGSYDGHLRAWDLQARSCVASTSVPPSPPGPGSSKLPEVHAVALTPDGRLALAGCSSKLLHAWELELQQPAPRGCSGSLAGHTSAVLCAAASPDGRHVVSGGEDHTVRLWSLQGSPRVRRAQSSISTLRKHEQSVLSVAFTPDGCYALSGSKDQSVCVWDLEPLLKPAPTAAPAAAAAAAPSAAAAAAPSAA